MVMQRTLSNQYINCWIDGSEYSEYYTYDELVNLAKKSSNPGKVISGLSQVISETSVFLWDVEANNISHVSVSNSTYNLAEDLRNSIKTNIRNLHSKNTLNFTNVDFKDNLITLKI